MLSERPEYNDKINVASLMAPVGFSKYLSSSTKAALTTLYALLLVYDLMIKNIFPQNQNFPQFYYFFFRFQASKKY